MFDPIGEFAWPPVGEVRDTIPSVPEEAETVRDEDTIREPDTVREPGKFEENSEEADSSQSA